LALGKVLSYRGSNQRYQRWNRKELHGLKARWKVKSERVGARKEVCAGTKGKDRF